jgi:FAD/FMN-containing dehydrogenase
MSQYEVAIKRGMEIMTTHGFPPTVVTRPMAGGHFGVLRFIEVFDKRNADDVKRVAALNAELCDMALEFGFIPYKTPVWVLKRHREKINANFLALLKRLKTTLDPNGILNPGKWLL